MVRKRLHQPTVPGVIRSRVQRSRRKKVDIDVHQAAFDVGILFFCHSNLGQIRPDEDGNTTTLFQLTAARKLFILNFNFVANLHSLTLP